MATEMQKRAVGVLVEKGGTVSDAMREVGYSENTIHTPSKLTESNGYIELMEIYLPDNKLLKALEEDIDGKPRNRKAELELAFKLKGRLKEKDGGGDVYNIAVFSNEQQRRIAERILGGDTSKSSGTFS